MKASLLKRLLSFPYYLKSWSSALAASERKDWEGIVRSLFPFEERGFANNESRHWVGCAFACLERWDEAVSQFELIDGSIKSPESDARRIYNHAYSLAKVERFAESTCLLEAATMSVWPSATEHKARRLLDYLREGSVGNSGVLN